MSLEAALQANTEAVLKLIDALAANDDRPAFVKNAGAADGNSPDAAEPKKRGPKPKAIDAAPPSAAADPAEHPAFKALVADVIKLVDLDNKNRTTRIAEVCAQFGVQKAGQLPPDKWAPFHETLKAAIAQASAPLQASASSFV